MKLNSINESTDITGKLDPLIAKYEKLKAKAVGNEELNFELMVDELKSLNTIESLKNFLKTMHGSLTDELKQLNILKAKATPDNQFRLEAYKDRNNSFKMSVSIYNDIIAYGKSAKLF
jgi:hypothetical protein